MRPFPLLLLLTAGLGGIGAGPAAAQSRAPFSNVAVSAGQTLQFEQEGTFHTLWRHRYGWEGALATPFYFGYVEVGGGYSRYANLVGTVPDFDATLLYVGWGPDLRLGPLRLLAGIRLGNHFMAFDEAASRGRRNESELLLGGRVRLQTRIVGGLAVHLGSSYYRTFTADPFDLAQGTVGLSYEVDSPRWLRGFLQ